jgi:hypothetical protein
LVILKGKEKICMDKNSMLYWWPRVRDLKVPMPKTTIIRSDNATLSRILDGEKPPESLVEEIRKVADMYGYPVFVRTDQASGKHDWERTCFVPSKKELFSHIYNILEFNECADIFGLPYEAIVIREYIPLESSFKAFHGNMPVAKERRYFAQDGKVLCHHPYWIKEAIEAAYPKIDDILLSKNGKEMSKAHRYSTLPDNWEQLLHELNIESEDEIELLSGYAAKISQKLPGYWSIDFAKGKDGTWYFIDAALGQDSWHPACNKKLL